MNYENVLKTFFFALCAGAVGLAGYIAKDGLTELKGIRSGINDLNQKMVGVIADQKWHYDAIKGHEIKIEELNKRVMLLERK